MLLQYAEARGWEVFGIYSDDDYAGADRKRPAFRRLLTDAEARKFDVVLCKTQSRFTREMELVEKYIHGLFPQWGIRFVSIVDNADTDNRGNKKSRQINGLVNEWYLEDMSENIRSVLTSRRQNGYHIGAFAPYGYKKDPEKKGHLIVDEEAAEVVREIFRLYAQGMGKTAIARLLNERGIPNATAYKLKQGQKCALPKKRTGSLWKYFSVGHVLTNEVYIGNMVQGKYGSVSYKTKANKPRDKSQWIRVEGTHEPIIERELWERVQRRIRERAKPFDSGEVGMFAGKVQCASCGYTLRSCKNNGKRYLRCPSRMMNVDVCEGAFLSVQRLERMVLEELNRLAREYLDCEALEKEFAHAERFDIRKGQMQREEAALRRQIDVCRKGMRALYADKLRGIITENDFAELMQEFLREKERLEGKTAEVQMKIGDLEKRMEEKRSVEERARQYAQLQRLTREAVEILIDHIAVGKRFAGTRMVPVEIHWNF